MTTTETTQLPANITAKFNLALAQNKFQILQTKADSLVYNEDNLNEIQEFLKQLKLVVKAVENTHKEGKAEALQIGRNWDNAKNTFLSQIEAIESKPKIEYDRICREIEQKRQEQEKERQRVLAIKNGIETNALNFAQRIANCKKSEELTNLERIINLEKGKKEKYQEFIDNAVERYNELNNLLAEQKVEVKKLEKLEQETIEAEKTQNDEKLLELSEQKEQIETKIEEQKIVVQETAISQTLNDIFEVAEVVLPTVKAKRTTWDFELIDTKEASRKCPELLEITLKKDKVKDVLRTIKETNQLEGKTEYILNGIRYFEVKTY